MLEGTGDRRLLNLAIPLKASVWKRDIANIPLAKASQMSKLKVHGGERGWGNILFIKEGVNNCKQ